MCFVHAKYRLKSGHLQLSKCASMEKVWHSAVEDLWGSGNFVDNYSWLKESPVSILRYSKPSDVWSLHNLARCILGLKSYFLGHISTILRENFSTFALHYVLWSGMSLDTEISLFEVGCLLSFFSITGALTFFSSLYLFQPSYQVSFQLNLETYQRFPSQRGLRRSYTSVLIQ